MTFGNASGAVPPVRASESEPPRRRARHTHLSNRSGAQVTPLKLIGKSAFMCRPKVRVCVRVAIRAEGAEVELAAARAAARLHRDARRAHLALERRLQVDRERPAQGARSAVQRAPPRAVAEKCCAPPCQVSVDKTFPLDEATDGHFYIEAGKSTGKVLYATS